MTTPIHFGQPSLALSQSIVVQGTFPYFSDSYYGGDATYLGFIYQTAFDPSKVKTLMQANGQTMSIKGNEALYALLSNKYGGDGRTNYKLPDLQGAAPIFLKPNAGPALWGKKQGSPDNSVSLVHGQLPSSLGGESAPIANQQYGLGMQYVIQVNGLYPYGDATLGTIGMVYPYAAAFSNGTPNGFLPADGRLLAINQNLALYSILGTTYGGDGRTTFALPDLRNQLPVGTGVTSSGLNIHTGQKLGYSALSLNNAEIAAPQGQPFNTMQPSLGMNYIINTTGGYQTYDDDTPMLGQVMLYAGLRIPDGWVLAQGQLLSIADNQSLYALIGTTFGGDGVHTFAVPDLRGRTTVGTGGVNNLQIGDVQGSFNEYITAANIPAITTPIPGVQILDENGQLAGDKITSKFELDISGVWPLARVQYSTDSTTWSETYTAQEGKNTLFVRQVNVLGQASAATAAITFFLDTAAPEAPQVMIDGAIAAMGVMGVMMAASRAKAAAPAAEGENIPRTSTGKLLFGNVEDGAHLAFSIDGGQTWTDSFAAQAGLNAVQVRQVDAAGHVSAASEVIRFYWDGSGTGAAATSVTTLGTGGNAITLDQFGALEAGLGTESFDFLIYDHQQDIVLPKDIEGIRLIENGLNNTVTGNAGNNVFEVVVGNWIIEGKEGQDTVMLSNPLADYFISQESYNGELQATILGPEGRIIVRGVETIVFSDATLIKVDEQNTTGVDYQALDHLYEEVLGRSPDIEGLTYWVAQMNQGVTLQEVVQSFSVSAEFKHLYGNPSNEQLVEELYEAILDRAPDTQGLSYWVQSLAVNEITEAELIVNLLISAESQAAANHPGGFDGLFVINHAIA